MGKSPGEGPKNEEEKHEEVSAAEAIPTELTLKNNTETKEMKAEIPTTEVKEVSAVPQEAENTTGSDGVAAEAKENVTSEELPADGSSKEEEQKEPAAVAEAKSVDIVKEPVESKVESGEAPVSTNVSEAKEEVSAEDVEMSEVSETNVEEGKEKEKDSENFEMAGVKKSEDKRHSVSDIVSQWNKNKSPLPPVDGVSSDTSTKEKGSATKPREIPDLPRSASSVKDKIKMFGSPEPRKLNSDAIKETIQRERHASVQSEVNDRLSSAKMAKYWEVTAEVKKSVVSEQTF